MSENENENAQQNTQQGDGPQFAIQRIYTKDISFETPNSPAIFTEKWEPQVNVELNSTGNTVAEGVYEVTLSVTVTAKLGDKTAYLAEVQQAGIFVLSGFSEQDLGGMIHSYCPNLLFPYVREVISDLVAKGSFPQMLLQPINFDLLYSQHLQQQQQQAGETPEEPVH
ncbi:MAG: protein-export chaperone SecB [Gammaproteobacteria bacterium]|nr:protein-export chaperone SecB [Gammaproteobacteria bacterium]